MLREDVSAYEDKRDPAANRRSWQRADSARPIPRRSYTAEDFRPLDAWITDLSRGGIALLLSRSVRPGALLFIELESLPEIDPIKTWATVVRCDDAGDGNWAAGCEFVVRLSEEDLEAVLR